jgi:hypothetical protein
MSQISTNLAEIHRIHGLIKPPAHISSFLVMNKSAAAYLFSQIAEADF